MSERVVWKYELRAVVNDVDLPVDSQVLHVAEQHGQICMWVLHAPAAEARPRRFYIVGTGHPLPLDALPPVHLGSLLVQGGTFVFHVFESLDQKLERGEVGMSTGYEARHQAVADATRLVRELHEVAEKQNPQNFTSVLIRQPEISLPDVLMVARFLLDEKDCDCAEVPPGPCGARLASLFPTPPAKCSLLAGHAGKHVATDGMTWGAR